MPRPPLPAVAVVALALAGCGADAEPDVAFEGAATVPPSAATPADPAAAAALDRPAAPDATRVAATTDAAAPATADTELDDPPLAGRTIVVDPGHNGASASRPDVINRTVWIGNRRKACQAVGTTSVRGLPEHRYTWLLAGALRDELRARGARVVLTRGDDRGVGPCIDRRARIANAAEADAAVSIHGDGGPATGRGFHVILPGRVPQVGGHDAIVAPSRRLGLELRRAYRRGSGMPYATYLGRAGLDVRTDLGGLNLLRVPGVMIETGNMRNATDARRMSSAAWRARAARALADGVTRFLER
ncbi:N-acetylmuramoyl-L-alanine amidase [Patulibacter brassicae]|uniref:N-acetylmuramoyl-L-alanine amidase n=1 Tax=Patulibacter brassicae TaxID=1705717 RepID=A0ABU4VM25_9ACTN|nr:N-acetylmuramoyl-L-alanine amidase [Patulibacter brassicae]MDX8152417.1 N-acetylmuramoyl-L-alanine amidase [Patulibacter brassicae]